MDSDFIRIKTAPSAEPVTLAEAKAQCRVDLAFTDDDTYLTSLITVARELAEKSFGFAIASQTVQEIYDKWPPRCFELRRPPVSAFTSITWYDENSVASIVPAADYDVELTLPPRVVLKADASWPDDELRSTGGIVLEYVAGTPVASPVKQWILLCISHFYEIRVPILTGQAERAAIPVPQTMSWIRDQIGNWSF